MIGCLGETERLGVPGEPEKLGEKRTASGSTDLGCSAWFWEWGDI